MGFLPLAALALTAAGTASEMVAASNTRSAENKAVDSQLQQQQQLQRQSTNIFNKNLPNNSQPAAQKAINAGQQNQLQQYAAMAQQPIGGSSAVSPVNVSPVVQARSDASTQNIGNANARLQGYSQWGVNQEIQNMLAGAQLGLIGNQSRNLYATLAPNLQQAQASQQGLAGAGSLLNTLGSVTGALSALPSTHSTSSYNATPGSTNKPGSMPAIVNPYNQIYYAPGGWPMGQELPNGPYLSSY